MKRLFALAFVILLSAIVAGCSRQYDTKYDYFNGKVLVEYHQTTRVGYDDTLEMLFSGKGQYDVAFTYTKGTENNRWNQDKAKLPQNFTISVEDQPLTKVIHQEVLPGFLTITITHGDATESHDFK